MRDFLRALKAEFTWKPTPFELLGVAVFLAGFWLWREVLAVPATTLTELDSFPAEDFHLNGLLISCLLVFAVLATLTATHFLAANPDRPRPASRMIAAIGNLVLIPMLLLAMAAAYFAMINIMSTAVHVSTVEIPAERAWREYRQDGSLTEQEYRLVGQKKTDRDHMAGRSPDPCRDPRHPDAFLELEPSEHVKQLRRFSEVVSQARKQYLMVLWASIAAAVIILTFGGLILRSGIRRGAFNWRDSLLQD